MAVYKKKSTRELPRGAELFTRDDEAWARWKDVKGKKREAKLSANGKSVLIESGVYMADFNDGTGRRVQRSTGCTTRDGANRKLAEWEAHAEKVRAGVLTPQESAISGWQNAPLARHKADYLAHLAAKGSTPRHVKDREAQLDRLFAECSFRRLRDLNREAFEAWINRQSKSNSAKGKAKETMSAARRNVYHAALVAFCNWAVEAKRISTNPFAGLRKANELADRRLTRRALTESDLLLLLDAARRRPLENALKGWRGGKMDADTRAGFERKGRERALIYKTLALTGLRRGELAAVSIGAVHLEGDCPHILLDARDEKSRRGANQPLRTDLVDDLSAWMRERLEVLQAEATRQGKAIPTRLPMDAKLFQVPKQLVRALNDDLKFAGIPKADGRTHTIDVHAFRKTFGSHLCKAGVPLRTTQAAMRHSTPVLTANIYVDPALIDVAGALDKLPALSEIPCKSTRSAAVTGGSTGAVNGAVSEGNPGPSSASVGNRAGLRSGSGTGGRRPRNGRDGKGLHAASSSGMPASEWHPQGDLNPCRRRERAVS